MGKRELGQLSIIDLIVSLLIAELATISIENYKGSILYSLIPIVILTLLQCILAYFSLKKPKFRIFLDGNPSVIIKNGKIVTYLDANKKEDLDRYQDTSSFESWLDKYIYLSK